MPLIAMEYAFGGGASQDPAGKSGLGNMVASLLDEGAGDLDSKTFHERLERRAIELSFSSARDNLRGSLRMLKDNKDEAFDLLRMALTSARFDPTDVERIRNQVLAGPAPRDHQSRRRWRAANSSSSPMAIIPMPAPPTARWRACRRSRSPT